MTELEQRRGGSVWRRSQERFASAILGSCFEELVRAWARRFAAPETFGGHVAEVGRGTITDPDNRVTIELDLLALGEPASQSRPRPLLAIGETKWAKRLDSGALARLDCARTLLRDRPGTDAARTRLVLASGNGFTDELHAEARRRQDEIVLVDLNRLYHGE